MHLRLDIILFIAVLALAIIFGAIFSMGDDKNETSQLSVDQPAAIAAGSGLEKGDVERGQDIALRLCSGCHAIPPVDVSPVPEAPLFTDLAERWPLDSLAEALAEGILVGHEEHVVMPEFTFEPQEIEDFLAFLESLKS